MSKTTILNYTRQTPTLFTDEQYTDVGTSFTLGSTKRAFVEAGFQIRTAAGGGGTLLAESVDYEWAELDSFYSQPANEGVNVWTKINILASTYETGDLFVTYSAVLTYATTSAIIDIIYPIGSQYTMYAVAADNDPDVAFPVAERPATLYGGTWALLWDSEGVFFRTEGDSTTADNDGRVDGLQADQMQRITGQLLRNYSPITPSGAFSTVVEGNNLAAGANAFQASTVNFNSANSPDARASATTAGETRPVNRLFRIYRRTA